MDTWTPCQRLGLLNPGSHNPTPFFTPWQAAADGWAGPHGGGPHHRAAVLQLGSGRRRQRAFPLAGRPCPPVRRINHGALLMVIKVTIKKSSRHQCINTESIPLLADLDFRVEPLTVARLHLPIPPWSCSNGAVLIRCLQAVVSDPSSS